MESSEAKPVAYAVTSTTDGGEPILGRTLEEEEEHRANLAKSVLRASIFYICLALVWTGILTLLYIVAWKKEEVHLDSFWADETSVLIIHGPILLMGIFGVLGSRLRSVGLTITYLSFVMILLLLGVSYASMSLLLPALIKLDYLTVIFISSDSEAARTYSYFITLIIYVIAIMAFSVYSFVKGLFLVVSMRKINAHKAIRGVTTTKTSSSSSSSTAATTKTKVPEKAGEEATASLMKNDAGQFV